MLCHLPFLSLHEPLNRFHTVCLEAAFFHVFFAQVKTPKGFIDICVNNRSNLLWPKHEHLFFHQCPTYIVNNATFFACWLNVKIKRNFCNIWPNYTVSWTMCYFNISMLVWISFIWYVNLSNMFSLAFKAKFCSVFCHGI